MLRRNLASCITSSQSTECRETPYKLVPSAVVRCLKPTKDLESFDDLRLAAFNSNSLKMDLRKFPAQQPMQESIFKLQQLWILAPLEDGLEMKT